MKIIPILILSLFLQGCGFLSYFKTKNPTLPPDKIVNIDKDALKLCIALNENLTISSFEDALVVYGDLATSYGICAKQQATSVKLIKKLGSIE